MIRAAVSVALPFVLLFAFVQRGTAEEPQARESEQMIEKLFEQVKTGDRQQFDSARRQLRSPRHREQAAQWLRAKAESDPDGQDGWLAEILLADVEHQQEMGALRGTFESKVTYSRTGFPVSTPLGTRHPGRRTRLFLPDEEIEYVPSETMTGSYRLFHYLHELRLPPSQRWGTLFGEVLLKGWYTPPPHLYEQHRLMDPITADDYVGQAMILLGELGERRAIPRVREILSDDEQGTILRAQAADVLVAFEDRDSAGLLMEVARNDKTRSLVRTAAFRALGRLGGAEQIPILESIANQEAQPSDSSPGYARGTISRIKRRLEAEAQAVP